MKLIYIIYQNSQKSMDYWVTEIYLSYWLNVDSTDAYLDLYTPYSFSPEDVNDIINKNVWKKNNYAITNFQSFWFEIQLSPQ